MKQLILVTLAYVRSYDNIVCKICQSYRTLTCVSVHNYLGYSESISCAELLKHM